MVLPYVILQCLAPRVFPNLSTAANNWARCHILAHSGFKAPDVTPGASITIVVLQMAGIREIFHGFRSGEMDPHTLNILKRYGITGFE
jgi:hypothetical protein